MASWNRLEDSELDARTIYVGAYGWDSCDAAGRVWARTPKQFATIIRRAMREEVRLHNWNGDGTDRATIGDLWYVGPFAQTVGETIADMDEPARADEFRDDVRAMSMGYSF